MMHAHAPRPWHRGAFVMALVLSLSGASLAAQGWQYGGFVDVASLNSFNDPANHLFRNRGTTSRVDEWNVNMAAMSVKKIASEHSRGGLEVTAQAGQDTRTFGFSTTAPNIGGAEFLLHLGATNVSYLAPIRKGVTIQGGIFSSLIGYDSLYAKDNFAYTRPWGADYTPYLMLGINASYPISDKLIGTIALVNGYWHLAHANDAPGIVGQLAFRASDEVSLKQTVLYGSHQPGTRIELWRVLSDTIIERKINRLTAAFEYQVSSERLDERGNPRALWMSAQLPIHWVIRGSWSAAVRPEFAWDRDGRWIAGLLNRGQSIKAFTSTLEYRASNRRMQAIVRTEYRVDNSHGEGGGFYDDRSGIPALVATQQLLGVAMIVTFDSAAR